MIPIYRTYDYTEGPIGFLAMEENKLKFRFKEPVSIEKVFEIFGNISVMFTETDDTQVDTRVLAGEITQYAYMAG